MMRFSRRVFIAVAVLIVASGAYAAYRLSAQSQARLQQFSDARTQGASIAQQIVDLSNQSADDLKKINTLDPQYKFDEALTLTNTVMDRSKKVRDLAVDLSGELEKMTRSLQDIQSPDARAAALDAISNRLALMSRLINYSAYLGQLLDTLHNRFAGASPGNPSVGVIVDEINAEVTAINSFNDQATQAMIRFDRASGQ